MKFGLLQSALRELKAVLSAPRLWIVFAAVVALFTVTGPFGTYGRLPLPTRLGYWLSIHAIAWLICLSVVVVVNRLLERLVAASLARMLVGGVVATPLIALGIIAVDMATLGDRFSRDALVAQIGIALPVTLLMCLFVWLVMDTRQGRSQPESPGPGPLSHAPEAAPRAAEPVARPRLLDRLDPQVRAPVLHLRVEDHYVDVVTRRGHQLVLMRFSDALLEIDGCAGLRVHRSHWVAADAVERILSDNGRLVLELVDGTRVPVSRPYVASVRNRLSDRPTGGIA